MKVSLLVILSLSVFSYNLRVFKPVFSLLEKENSNAVNLQDINGAELTAGSLFLETSSELLAGSADGSSKTGSDSFIEISRNIDDSNSNSFLQTELTKGGTRVGDKVSDYGYNGNNDVFLQIGTELTKGGTRSGYTISEDGFISSNEDYF